MKLHGKLGHILKQQQNSRSLIAHRDAVHLVTRLYVHLPSTGILVAAGLLSVPLLLIQDSISHAPTPSLTFCPHYSGAMISFTWLVITPHREHVVLALEPRSCQGQPTDASFGSGACPLSSQLLASNTMYQAWKEC